MDTICEALDAFLQEHRRCGEMDGGFDGVWVWMTCDCGALLAHEPKAATADASDAIAHAPGDGLQMLRKSAIHG